MKKLDRYALEEILRPELQDEKDRTFFAEVLASMDVDLRRRLAEAVYPEGAGIGFIDALTEMLFDPNIEKKP